VCFIGTRRGHEGPFGNQMEPVCDGNDQYDTDGDNEQRQHIKRMNVRLTDAQEPCLDRVVNQIQTIGKGPQGDGHPRLQQAHDRRAVDPIGAVHRLNAV